MYPFLDSIPLGPLEGVTRDISSIDIDQSKHETDEEHRALLYRVLFANVGFDILYEKRIRRCLFESLDLSALRSFCDEHRLDTANGRPFDLALVASNVPWRAGSVFVFDFGRLFSINPVYLPRREDRPSSVEIVEPSEELPELFPYQWEMKRQIDDFLARKDARAAMLQLPTGAGKTRTAVESLTDLTCKSVMRDDARLFIWLAHTEELCDQAAETIIRIWRRRGSIRLPLIRLWGDYDLDVNAVPGAVVISSFSKLLSWRRRNPDWHFVSDHFSVVVIDEAHRALAPTMREMVETVIASNRGKVLGLTATPGRGEIDQRESRRLAELFGKSLLVPISLGDDPIATLQRDGVLADLQWEVLETGIEAAAPRNDDEGAEDAPPRLLRLLAANDTRNELIVDRVSAGVRDGRQVLIYACTVEHARTLASLLAARGIATASIDSRMRSWQRRALIASFRRGDIQVLSNFGVLSTGFDAPNISLIVVCRPTSSAVLYAQMVGRGLRGPRAGGTKECLVVDVRDNLTNYGDLAAVYSSFGQFWRT